MKISSHYILLTALLCLLVAGVAGAQDKKMYSWTDENGTVHFTDTRPDGQNVVESAIPQDAPPASDNPYQTKDTGPSPAQLKREEISRNNQEAQINKAVKSAECAAWKAEVDRLEPNRRVFFTNEQGETERMDDVERTNRVAQLKSQIARNCK